MKATGNWITRLVRGLGVAGIGMAMAIGAAGCGEEVRSTDRGATWSRTAGETTTGGAPTTAALDPDKEKYAPKKAADTVVGIVTPSLKGLTTGTSAVTSAATAAPAPTTGAGWTRAARERLDAGDAKGARDAAVRAVELAPESAGAFNALGRAHLGLGTLEEARKAFATATELNPLSSHAHNNLGLVLIYQGEFESAARELELAVGLTPVEGYMWNNLGMALEHLGRFEDARDAYREGSAIGSKLAAANLARIADRKDPTLAEELDWMVDPVVPSSDRETVGDGGVPVTD